MKKLFFAIIINSFFIFIAFGSSESEPDSTSTNTENNEKVENVCYNCNGYGKYTPKSPAGFVSKTRKCTTCNGTGKTDF